MLSALQLEVKAARVSITLHVITYLPHLETKSRSPAELIHIRGINMSMQDWHDMTL
jgi:hypothetical protein